MSFHSLPYMSGVGSKQETLHRCVLENTFNLVIIHAFGKKLAIALARLFEGPKGFRDMTFHRADQQALCSLISFQLGAAVGRCGDRLGPWKRIWLISGTILQALLTMAAAVTLWQSGEPSIANTRADPSWNNVLSFVALAFMSASLGVQGVLGKRLNTQFGTTIVLTTVWVELVSDPRLFEIRQKVESRDHKLLAAVALFVGAFSGHALLAKIGSPATLGIAVGFRILIAISWVFIPSENRLWIHLEASESTSFSSGRT
ncbi:hypothetical protein H2248_002132 [Termitomyces sp. 'cryptogamus']|nr:hypothetical protein H2248_002132 [Termitomyces sp. 'cryptogamus']